jgi:hypothetical protein
LQVSVGPMVGPNREGGKNVTRLEFIHLHRN